MVAPQQTERDPREMAAWHDWIIRTPREALELVGFEGLDRLLFTPTVASREAVDKRTLQAFGFQAGDEMNSFWFNLCVEVCDVAISLGIALGSLGGKLDPTAGSFEDWLQVALKAADLEAYTPRTTLNLDRLAK